MYILIYEYNFPRHSFVFGGGGFDGGGEGESDEYFGNLDYCRNLQVAI